MCCQTKKSSCDCRPVIQTGCQCGCDGQGYLSKKKKIQALKEKKSCIEDRLDDIKAYIKELEAGN